MRVLSSGDTTGSGAIAELLPDVFPTEERSCHWACTVGLCAIRLSGLSILLTIAAGAQSLEPTKVLDPLLTSWASRSGFGPAFNATSCAACHANRMTLMVYLSVDVIDPTGGHVVAQFSRSPSGAIERRPLPQHASVRRAPAVAGLGLIELVERAAIEELTDPDDEDGDGVSGRLPSGRFGWKAQFPDLTRAVAAAFANEFGLSSPWFGERYDPSPAQPDLSREEVEAVADYVRSLPPPRSRHVSAPVQSLWTWVKGQLLRPLHRTGLNLSAGSLITFGGGNLWTILTKTTFWIVCESPLVAVQGREYGR